mmetsp:Transcript_2432/g.10110  ORF Transcript_2432/g.10110 Transcript_2432/m.10110 type:complete len:216 (+) Transcript_2432:1487-2134(+)
MFANRSKSLLSTSAHPCSVTPGRSTLFRHTTGLRPFCSALESTNLVCAIGPSCASTRSRQPSTMSSTRSTSPPKSAWPGVSTALNTQSRHGKDVYLLLMVMPRSFSRSLLSIRRSEACWPPWFISVSSSVVLPWSTCAMMAKLRTFVSATSAAAEEAAGEVPKKRAIGGGEEVPTTARRSKRQPAPVVGWTRRCVAIDAIARMSAPPPRLMLDIV